MIMVRKNESIIQQINWDLLSRKMLQGGGLALLLITIFLLGVKEPDPEWGKLWMARPLIIVSLAGAGGGMFYYFMAPMRHTGGWRRIIANLSCLIVYIIALWLGTVLGLDGTLWN
jgi:hypothetical protein